MVSNSYECTERCKIFMNQLYMVREWSVMHLPVIMTDRSQLIVKVHYPLY